MEKFKKRVIVQRTHFSIILLLYLLAHNLNQVKAVVNTTESVTTSSNITNEVITPTEATKPLNLDNSVIIPTTSTNIPLAHSVAANNTVPIVDIIEITNQNHNNTTGTIKSVYNPISETNKIILDINHAEILAASSSPLIAASTPPTTPNTHQHGKIENCSGFPVSNFRNFFVFHF